jgi:hypothetical protein
LVYRIFRQALVLDAADGTRAGNDLRLIIALSGFLKKQKPD